MREYPILCCDVSCYYSKKNFLRDSDRSYTNQPVQICELAIYGQVRAKKSNIIYFHLKITMFYSPEKNELLAWEYKPYASSILKIQLFQHFKL